MEDKTSAKKAEELAGVAQIATTLVPFVPVAGLEFTLNFFETMLNSANANGRKNGPLEKSCYKALRHIFEHDEVQEVGE